MTVIPSRDLVNLNSLWRRA